MRKIILVLMLLYALPGHGQVLQGRVTDRHNTGIPGVNIFIKGHYEGATTDTAGVFEFTTKVIGTATVVAQGVGYELQEKAVTIDEVVAVNFMLKESVNSLKAVVITAGTFEAGDEQKNVIFKPFDIATTAGANADIYGALQVLPGVQQVGEANGMYVRGGDASEANTYIDGLLVQHPFLSSTSDVAQRGRFSPFLFKGTSFSTGGYSAQFGQALSSALNLNLSDLPEESSTQVQLMSAGIGAIKTRRWENSSLSADLSYINAAPTVALVPQNREWTQPLEQGNLLLTYKYRTSKAGMLKVLSNFSSHRLGIMSFNPASAAFDTDVDLKNQYSYTNINYTGLLPREWVLKAGVAHNFQHDKVSLNEDLATQQDNLTHARVTLTGDVAKNNALAIGVEHMYFNLSQGWNRDEREINENYSASFAEMETYLSARFALRTGLRLEYSQQLQDINLAPRASLAFKVTDASLVSMSYGKYYQTPKAEHLFQSGLQFQQAEHAILNFQWQQNDRLFRAEAYAKSYQRLVAVVEGGNTYGNSGNGYARGIDLFFRDKAIIRRGDIWLTYSYIDAKRKYDTFPTRAQPAFVANHTASVVYKQYLSRLKTYAGITYRFASGRPYFNPNNPEFLADRTDSYQNLSLNVSYITSLFGYSSIVYFSFANVPGFRNRFGYYYAENGGSRFPIQPVSDRSLFLALFLTIK